MSCGNSHTTPSKLQIQEEATLLNNRCSSHHPPSALVDGEASPVLLHTCPSVPTPSPLTCALLDTDTVIHFSSIQMCAHKVHGEERRRLETPGGSFWGRNAFRKVNPEHFCLHCVSGDGQRAEGGAGGCAPLLHPPPGANYLHLRGVKSFCWCQGREEQ